MVTVNSIVSACRSLLDAEGNSGAERYHWSRDFYPSIILTQKWISAAMSRALGEKKFSGESLRDLFRTRIWVTSQYSRIMYSSADTGHNLWTIVAVHPKAEVVLPTGDSLPTTTTNSEFVGSASFIKSRYSAERVSREAYDNRFNNSMLAGSSGVINADLIRYAYITFDDYNGFYDYSGSVQSEIEIAPDVASEAVAISYLKVPSEPSNSSEVAFLASELEWPETLTPLIVDRVLKYISYKRDSKPQDISLMAITNSEITNMISMLT